MGGVPAEVYLEGILLVLLRVGRSGHVVPLLEVVVADAPHVQSVIVAGEEVVVAIVEVLLGSCFLHLF